MIPVMKTIREASVVWRHLNGIICVYKPPRKTTGSVLDTIKSHLARDLNKMKVRPPTPRVVIEGGENGLIAAEPEIKVVPSYADNVLVTGPRYIKEEVRCLPVHRLGFRTSGLILFGVNGGCRAVKQKNYHQLVRVYQIGIRLGLETDSGWYDEGMGVAKSRFSHVPVQAVNNVLSAIQAAYMRRAYEYAGVLPESQEAYELAQQGLVKPKSRHGCVIYSARLLDFKLPDFTIEMSTLNENEEFFLSLAVELGRRLRSAATVTSIKCVQLGNFGVEHSLSSGEWDLTNFLKNMRLCHKLSKENTELRDVSELDDMEGSNEPIYDDTIRQ